MIMEASASDGFCNSKSVRIEAAIACALASTWRQAWPAWVTWYGGTDLEPPPGLMEKLRGLMGRDSDDEMARGEVGKEGVAIDSLADMLTLFEGIPLDKVSTSMTINAPAAILLLMYEIVAAEQGISSSKINGTIQNDILKEYIARGTYIYPPGFSLRLITDILSSASGRLDRKSTRLNSSHMSESRMPSSA